MPAPVEVERPIDQLESDMRTNRLGHYSISVILGLVCSWPAPCSVLLITAPALSQEGGRVRMTELSGEVSNEHAVDVVIPWADDGSSRLVIVKTPEAQQEAIDSLEEGLLGAIAADGQFKEPADLRKEFVSTVRALVTGNGDAYYDSRIERGCALRRQVAIALAEERRAWGWIDTSREELARLPDKALFLQVWRSAREHGYRIKGIDASDIQVGHGLVQLIGGRSWPYDGMQGANSLFSPAEHERDQGLADAMTDPSKTAFLRLGVYWEDAGPGHIRINLVHDGVVWRVQSVSIGASGKGWPWPVL